MASYAGICLRVFAFLLALIGLALYIVAIATDQWYMKRVLFKNLEPVGLLGMSCELNEAAILEQAAGAKDLGVGSNLFWQLQMLDTSDSASKCEATKACGGLAAIALLVGLVAVSVLVTLHACRNNMTTGSPTSRLFGNCVATVNKFEKTLLILHIVAGVVAGVFVLAAMVLMKSLVHERGLLDNVGYSLAMAVLAFIFNIGSMILDIASHFAYEDTDKMATLQENIVQSHVKPGARSQFRI